MTAPYPYINDVDSINSVVFNETAFVLLIKTKWDEINMLPNNVFRYGVNDLKEKQIDGKYTIMMNIERGTNRRAPEDIVNIQQPFDEELFNFTKVDSREKMFSMESKGEEHTIILNVSPILRYHSLLCPFVKRKLPQVVTRDSLEVALEIMFLGQDRDLRIVFNSLCALASVNHLHYHLIIHNEPWPVEEVKWKQISGPLHCLQDYPIDAFCFEVQKETLKADAAEIYKLIKYFLKHSIAHNIIMTMKTEKVDVVVYPRKNATGVKEFTDFNMAALELSGLITVYSAEAFENIQSENIEAEMKKWKIDNFDELCNKVELLYKSES